MAYTKEIRKGTKKWLSQGGLISGLLIAILPKCPFCIMAYTGAIAMCSGKNIYPHDGATAALIGMCFSILIIVSIVLNNRGRRTIYAISLALLGIIVLGLAQFVLMDGILYYVGAIILLFAVWLNGSFMYFASRLHIYLKSIQLRNN